MKRFHFRLEKLITIRRHREEKLEIELAKAVSKVLGIENEIRFRTTEKSRVFNADSAGDIEYEMVKARYIFRLDKEVNDLRKKLDKALKQREEAKEKFLAASRERKVLDKLKERKQAEFYHQQKMEEIKESDDTVTANSGRER